MRITRMGIALVAVLAFGALAAGSAVALPEYGQCVAKAGGKYSDGNCTKKATGGAFEFVKTFPNTSFTSSGGEGVLETVSGTKVICTSQSAVGEFHQTGTTTKVTKEVWHVTATFTGCNLPLIGASCQSAGQAAGTIATNSLYGKVGYISKAKKTVEQELKPEKSVSSKLFASFECGAGAVKIEVGQGTGKGGDCIYATIEPTNTSSTTSTETYSGSGGVQNPSKLEGSTKTCNLESRANGGSWERATQSLLTTITTPEAIELKA